MLNLRHTNELFIIIIIIIIIVVTFIFLYNNNKLNYCLFQEEINRCHFGDFHYASVIRDTEIRFLYPIRIIHKRKNPTPQV